MKKYEFFQVDRGRPAILLPREDRMRVEQIIKQCHFDRTCASMFGDRASADPGNSIVDPAIEAQLTIEPLLCLISVYSGTS